MGKPAARLFASSVALTLMALAGTPVRADVQAGAGGGGGADGEVGGLPPMALALRALEREFPGVRTLETFGQTTALYGVPMTSAATPEEAASAWLKQYGPALGGGEDLRLARVDVLSGERFTCYTLDQFVEGLPVEYGMVKVLVWNDVASGQHRAVYVGAKVAQVGDAGFLPDAVDGALATTIAQQQHFGQAMPQWKDAEPIVYFGEGDALGPGGAWVTPIRAWRVTGYRQIPGQPELDDSYTFIIDAASGVIVKVRRDIMHTVTGTVTGRATSGLLADSSTNTPGVTPVPIPGARITVNAASVFATLAGGYTTAPLSGLVSVTADFQGLPTFTIVNNAGANSSLTQSVTAPGNVDFVFNSTPTEFVTAEVNALITVRNTREFWRTRAPGFTALDFPLPINVNVNATCNATFNPTAINLNFYRSGGGCNNTAYTTVASHEFGHFVVNRLGLAQGSFGEGFGDCNSILIYDTFIVGDGFRIGATPGTAASYIRNVEAANQQFPCSAAIHTCGQVLGGSWRDIRDAMVPFYPADGLARTQQMFVDWALVTLGGSGNDAAYAQTAIEVLTINDTDGNLGNGTPDYPRICTGFSQHSIACPTIQRVEFVFPDGQPSLLTPATATTLRVNVVPLAETPIAGSLRMWHRFTPGTGPYTQSIPVQGLPNEYLATLPATPCGGTLEYYFTATTVGNPTPLGDPSSAPAVGFRAGAGYGVITQVDDPMESVGGWTVSGVVTSGAWENADPQGTFASGVPVQPEDDATPSGTNCWVTGPLAGTAIGSFDVDGGSTVLTSPLFDLSSGSGYTVSYKRWYSNARGSAPAADTMVVEISNNDGGSWVTAETIGPATQNDGGWISASWAVSSFVTPTSQVRVRFTASDVGSGSVVEAAVDDFAITRIDCDPPAPTCLADITEIGGTEEVPGTPDGQLTVDDLILFVNLFSSGAGCPGTAPCSRADVTGIGGSGAAPDGALTVDDLIEFVNSYSAGCAG